MASFFSISIFRTHLDELLQIKRGVYARLVDEIIAAFRNLSITDIRNNRDMILIENEFVVVKYRLPDKKHRLSKKDGYRLIYLVFKKEEKVVFLDIYPKRGPMQKIGLSDDELLDLLEIYNEENSRKTLEEFGEL